MHPRQPPYAHMTCKPTTAPRTSATSASNMHASLTSAAMSALSHTVTLRLNRSDRNGKTERRRQTGDIRRLLNPDFEIL